MRKKLILGISIPVILLLLLSILGYGIFSKLQEKSKYAAQAPIPNFVFETLQEQPFSSQQLKQHVPVLLLYFQPGCELCQEETDSLLTHIDLFKEAQIVMVSPAPKEEILHFVSFFKLGAYPEIMILRDSKNEFDNLFGNTTYPSAFVYDANHNLIQYFKGITKVTYLHKVMFNT